MANNKENRVSITYEQATNGAQKSVEIPFVSLVMSDLSGKSKKEKPDIAERRMEEINHGNFNTKMKSIEPRVTYTVNNKLTNEGQIPIELTFKHLDDFSPAQVAKQIPATNELLKARAQLANLKANLDGKANAEKLLQSLLDNDELLEQFASINQAEQDADMNAATEPTEQA